MAKFFSLSSSSKGNSYFVSDGNTSLLIDAGISTSQIKTQLGKHGIDLKDIDGILVTHEHTDHICGLNVLTKNYNIPIYSAEETLQFMLEKGKVQATAPVVPVAGDFSIGDIHVTSFDTPHDAIHSIGFRLELSGEHKIGFATDLGVITPCVRESLEGCDFIMLESNFDYGMLECSQYPYPIKLRIKSETGHLANEDCAKEVAHLIRTGSTRFMLGHLSEQSNMPQLAYATTKSILEELDIIEGSDYLIAIAPARTASNMVIL